MDGFNVVQLEVIARISELKFDLELVESGASALTLASPQMNPSYPLDFFQNQ